MEEPRFHIIGEKITVTEVGSEREILAPEIAAKAMRAFTEAIDAAGGTIEVPDDIAELFKVNPTVEE